MNKFDLILSEFTEELGKFTFSEALREARDRVGLMQYRVAEHLKMSLGRLKNLETGYFRVMPSASEIRDICEFYQLPREEMIRKAELHVARRERDKKIRTINDG